MAHLGRCRLVDLNLISTFIRHGLLSISATKLSTELTVQSKLSEFVMPGVASATFKATIEHCIQELAAHKIFVYDLEHLSDTNFVANLSITATSNDI